MKTLSIVIPAYNEERYIGTLLEQISAVDLGSLGLAREIIVVDDCSKDRTAEIVASVPGVRLHRMERNGGKGRAVRAGISLATGEYLIIQDADLEYDPADYMKLLQPVIDGQADVVYGSRFIGEPHRVLYFWHTLGNKVITFLSNMFTNLNLTDVEVCYKLFRRPVLQRIAPLKCNRFGFEVEVTAKVARLRPPVRIFEVGISYYGRSYEEGKKITWKDGIKAILAIVRFRFRD